MRHLSHLRTAEPQPDTDALPPMIEQHESLGRAVNLLHFANFIGQPFGHCAALADPHTTNGDGEQVITFTTAMALMGAFGTPHTLVVALRDAFIEDATDDWCPLPANHYTAVPAPRTVIPFPHRSPQ
jgi:hypothetical protein